MLPIGHVFPEVRIGPFSSSIVAAYASASGDDNPIHSDVQAARSIGLPAPVLHGMLIMGIFEKVCAQWGLNRAASHIESRFVRPMRHDAVLAFSGRVVAHERGCLRIRIVVRDSAGELGVVGSVEIRPSTNE